MKISETFSGTYYNAKDFAQSRTLTIESVVQSEFEDGCKPAVKFQGESRQLVLNKTNAIVLAHAMGDETDRWTGRQIQVFTAPTSFQGRMTQGIRVQPVDQSSTVDEQPQVRLEETQSHRTGNSLPTAFKPQMPPQDFEAAQATQKPTPPPNQHTPVNAPRWDYPQDS